MQNTVNEIKKVKNAKKAESRLEEDFRKPAENYAAKVLLVLQHNGETIDESSLRLCANINRFAGRAGAERSAVIFGSCNPEALKLLGKYGVTRVHSVTGSPDNYYSPEQRVNVVVELAESLKPDLLILPGTLQGREMAPLLAYRLEAGFAADCLELGCRDGKTEAVLKVYSGQYQMLCEFSSAPNVILMADVNPGVIEPDGREEAEIITLSTAGLAQGAAPIPGHNAPSHNTPGHSARGHNAEPALQVVDTFYLPAAELDIAEADIVLGIGRGVQTREDFRLMQDLASAIGAPLGGSRPAVDAGWLNFRQQIGQTGRIIAPELYLAVGISGAQQHISGVEKAKIIAINTDPQAPILRLADLGVVGDFQEVVPLVIRKLQDIRKEGLQ